MPSPSKRSTRVVSTRLKHAEAAALGRFLTSKQLNASEYLRCCALALSSGDEEAALILLEDLAHTLGVDAENMSQPEFQRAIAALFEKIKAPADGDALGEAPAELSRAEFAACAKNGISPRDFLARKAKAVRRVGKPAKAAPRPATDARLSRAKREELAACAKKGISPSEFQALKAAAAKRQQPGAPPRRAADPRIDPARLARQGRVLTLGVRRG